MSAPVFVVDPAVLAGARPGSTIDISGAEGRHAVTVTRLQAGEAVDVVDGQGSRASAIIQSTDRSSMQVAVRAVSHESEPQPRIVVIQALAKGDRGELAVEQLTEIGVDEIVPWSAAHCVVQWKSDRLEKSHQRWTDAAYAAAKQSRRARFPLIAPLADTHAVVARMASAQAALVLHESATHPIGPWTSSLPGEVLIVVGPEGGLSAAELAAFTAAGASVVRLGPTVLRTSSAGIAAVAALLSGSTRWAVSGSDVEG